MEKVPTESAPQEKEAESKEEAKGEGISRRKFLKILGIGAGMAATGELLNPKSEAAAETQPVMGFQIREGKAGLVHLDPKGNVERYEVIASARDLGLVGKDTEVMTSPEVTEAARRLQDLGARCREKGDVEACRSITLATVDLSEAVRSARVQALPKGRGTTPPPIKTPQPLKEPPVTKL